MEQLKLVRPEKRHARQAECLTELMGEPEIWENGESELMQSNYDAWMEKLACDRTLDDEGLARETFFLIRGSVDENWQMDEATEEIVGVTRVLIVLKHGLLQYGGNIECAILPNERRKGYGRVGLFLSLYICANYGMTAALIDCPRTNIGAMKIAEAVGGHFFQDYSRNGRALRQYAIDINYDLEKYERDYVDIVHEFPEYP